MSSWLHRTPSPDVAKAKAEADNKAREAAEAKAKEKEAAEAKEKAESIRIIEELNQKVEKSILNAAHDKSELEAKLQAANEAKDKLEKELNQKVEKTILNAAHDKYEFEAKFHTTNEAEKKLKQYLETTIKAAEIQKQLFEEQLIKTDAAFKEKFDKTEAKLESIIHTAAREKAELRAEFEIKMADYIASISSKPNLENADDKDGYTDQIIKFFKHAAEEELNNSAPLKAIVAIISKLKDIVSSDNESIKNANQLELKEQLISLNNKIIDIINSKPEYQAIFDVLVKDNITTAIKEICNSPEIIYSNSSNNSDICDLYKTLASASDIISLSDNQDNAALYAARGELCLTEPFVQAPICTHFFDAY